MRALSHTHTHAALKPCGCQLKDPVDESGEQLRTHECCGTEFVGVARVCLTKKNTRECVWEHDIINDMDSSGSWDMGVRPAIRFPFDIPSISKKSISSSPPLAIVSMSTPKSTKIRFNVTTCKGGTFINSVHILESRYSPRPVPIGMVLYLKPTSHKQSQPDLNPVLKLHRVHTIHNTDMHLYTHLDSLYIIPV
jgi:hypothetical protein